MSTEGGPGSTEGYHSWERARDIQRAENMVSPETRAAIIEEISLLLYKIIEIGPAMDPATVRKRRAQLRAALGKLGIDLDKPHWGVLYRDQVWQALEELQFPPKPEGYPTPAEFSAMINELQQNEEYVRYFDGVTARQGDNQTLAEYLFGLGFVMSSHLSYDYIFPPQTDPIIVNRATGEVEGRHRFLTLLVLEKLGYPATRKWYWVLPKFIR